MYKSTKSVSLFIYELVEFFQNEGLADCAKEGSAEESSSQNDIYQNHINFNANT